MFRKLVSRGVRARRARRKRSPIAGGLLMLAVLVPPAAGPAAAQEPGEISYAREPQAVVVSYVEDLGELEDEDPGPSLKVYGDGRVVVHYPAYMKRAGDYTLQLTESEMDALLSSLVSQGVLEFDEEGTRKSVLQQPRTAAPTAGREVSFTTDASVVRIDINVNQVERSLSWSSLRQDAALYPQVKAIQDLAAAQRELEQLMQRDDLERIEGESEERKEPTAEDEEGA